MVASFRLVIVVTKKYKRGSTPKTMMRVSGIILKLPSNWNVGELKNSGDLAYQTPPVAEVV